MRKLGKAQLGAVVFFASSHPGEVCGSNGLPLTPNSIKIVGRFQILKTIQHPHLCKYISIVRGKHGKKTTADSGGRTLHTKFKGLSEKLIEISYEVLRGLSYLNEYGIVHRNLTPENILLDNEGHVKLAKFGLYHMTDNGTSVSFPIGSPVYLAPEVLSCGPILAHDHLSPPSVNSLGFRVDVWSLGIILAEITLGIDLRNEDLEEIFVILLELILDESEEEFLEKIAKKFNVYEKLHLIDENLRSLIEKCLQVSPKKRLSPEKCLKLEIFSSLHQSGLVERGKMHRSFISIDFQFKNLNFPIEMDPLNENEHLEQRSIDEIYYLWRLAGGDLESELKKEGIVKMMPSICSLPLIVTDEGEFFGQKKDRAFLLDETVVILPLDQLRQRLSKVKPEAYYPLVIEESAKLMQLDQENSDDVTGMAELPLVIREKDIEYQFHRIILFERLLHGYPYKRPHILKEAKIDVLPLFRAHIWAALLEIEGDVQGRYDSIDKETPIPTDRQIEVDIPRCHQYDELLSSPDGHMKFKRILKAWIVSHSQYVYWQGLDSLCAPFLSLNFNDEALAYACMSAFITKYLHKFFLKDNSPVIQEYLAVFSHLIAFHDPELANHLNSIGFIPELYSIPWFLTMYTHMLPLHKIFHLWDTLLLGDPSFPLFIGVVILQQLRDNLLSFGFNECILLFSDMPEINIERCLLDSIKIFCSTPRSATYRQYEKPTARKKIRSPSVPTSERLQSELEKDPILLDALKSEVSPRISGADLLELLEVRNSTAKKFKQVKSKLLIVDVRAPEEFSRGAVPDSINIPFQSAFSPDGKLNSCAEVSILNAHQGRIIIIVGNRGNSAVNVNIVDTSGFQPVFADQIVRLGYSKVCTLHKGIDVLRSTGILVVPTVIAPLIHNHIRKHIRNCIRNNNRDYSCDHLSDDVLWVKKNGVHRNNWARTVRGKTAGNGYTGQGNPVIMDKIAFVTRLPAAERCEMDNEELTLKLIYNNIQLTIKNYKTCPSLQRIVLVRMATSLWSQDDIRSKINFYFGKLDAGRNDIDDWLEIEEFVSKKANEILIPNLRQPDLVYATEVIGSQIHDWIKYLYKFTWYRCKTSYDFINDIAWTVHGTIDRKKTFDLLLNNKILKTNGGLYNLACNLCLKHQIPHLWNDLPDDLKIYYNGAGSLPEQIPKQSFSFSTQIRKFLTQVNDLSFLDDQVLLQLMLDQDHDLALEYFCDLMPPERKSELIVNMWNLSDCFDCRNVIYFLLSHSTVEQVMANTRLNYRATNILRCVLLLVKPWQVFCPSEIARLIQLLRAAGYDIKYIMCLVNDNVTRVGNWDVFYKKLMVDLWKTGHDGVRKYFDFYAMDVDLIKMMIVGASEERKHDVALFEHTVFFEMDIALMYFWDLTPAERRSEMTDKVWDLIKRYEIVYLLHFISDPDLDILIGESNENITRGSVWRVVYKPFLEEMWDLVSQHVKDTFSRIICDFDLIKMAMAGEIEERKSVNKLKMEPQEIDIHEAEKEVTRLTNIKKKEKPRKWREIEDDVWEAAVNNILANVWRREFEFAISTTAVEMKEWIEHLETYTIPDVTKNYVNDIIWTEHGTIDKKKTFELLAANETLRNNGSLYNLACNFCFVDRIREFWNYLEEPLQRDYKNKIVRCTTSRDNFEVVFFWTSMNNYKIFHSEIWAEMFRIACKGKLDLAVRYFWDRMRPEQRNQAISKCLKKDAETFYFLLTKMDLDQMGFLNEENSFECLKHLISFNQPVHEYLIPTMKLLTFKFLSEEKIELVILMIVEQISENRVSGLFSKMFLIELWKDCSNGVKSTLLTNHIRELKELMRFTGLDVFAVMIKELHNDVKYEILNSKKSTCFNIVVNGGDVMMDDFLNVIYASDDQKEAISVFKNELAVFGIEFIRFLLIKDKYEMFLCWCLRNDEKIVEFKKKFCNFLFLEKKLRSFCTSRTVKDLDKFLKWCLVTENDERTQLQALKIKNEERTLVSQHYLIYEDHRCSMLMPRDCRPKIPFDRRGDERGWMNEQENPEIPKIKN
uniref:TBC domain-containing protein kinase-like protein n=1 Tax=Strigamia maritima TaxID=126957 RepID=T1J4P7_STRMM